MEKQYCFRCQELVDVFSAVDVQKEIHEGQTVMITWISYHCMVCRSFLRGEEKERHTRIAAPA